MTAIITLTLLAIVATICYVCEHQSRILKSLGFGYLVYHSDSQKTFWSMTYQDAMEWVACAIGDTCLIDNRSKETIAIRFASK